MRLQEKSGIMQEDNIKKESKEVRSSSNKEMKNSNQIFSLEVRIGFRINGRRWNEKRTLINDKKQKKLKRNTLYVMGMAIDRVQKNIWSMQKLQVFEPSCRVRFREEWRFDPWEFPFCRELMLKFQNGYSSLSSGGLKPLFCLPWSASLPLRA